MSETMWWVARDGALLQGQGRSRGLPSFPLTSSSRRAATREPEMEGAPSAVCLVHPPTSSLCSKNHWLDVPFMFSDRNETKDALCFYFLILPQSAQLPVSLSIGQCASITSIDEKQPGAGMGRTLGASLGSSGACGPELQTPTCLLPALPVQMISVGVRLPVGPNCAL